MLCSIYSPPPSPAYVGGYCSSGPKLEDLYDEMDQLENHPPQGASDEIPAALREEATHIFENYSFDHSYSPDLPITAYRQQILDTIESNSVTVIQGVLKTSCICLAFYTDILLARHAIFLLGRKDCMMNPKNVCVIRIIITLFSQGIM